MARSRVLKPEFFKNEVLASLSHATRLLFPGLWCLADREGRLKDRPARIAAEVFPYETLDVDTMLEELAGAGFIVRYVVDGEGYLAIPTFLEHQRPHFKEAPSRIPAPIQVGASTDLDRGEHRSRSPVSVSVSVSDPVSVSDSVSIPVSGSVSISDPVSHAPRAFSKPADKGNGKIHALAYEIRRLNPNTSAETLIDTLQWTVRQRLKIDLPRAEAIQYLQTRGSL